MIKKPNLSELEITESCIQILRTFQAKVNEAVKDAKLKGDEPHALNVINNGLFGLLMQASLFVEKEEKVKETYGI